MNQNIKKLSQRMKEQRLKVADRIGKQVPLPKVLILPKDVEHKGQVLAEMIRKNGEELAANVETVVDKVGVLVLVLGQDLEFQDGVVWRVVWCSIVGWSEVAAVWLAEARGQCYVMARRVRPCGLWPQHMI
jgi:hypothetical protein